MPAFTFEKISPPPRRGPVAPIAVKKRSVVVQILDRLVDARAKREEENKRKKKTRVIDFAGHSGARGA